MPTKAAAMRPSAVRDVASSNPGSWWVPNGIVTKESCMAADVMM